MIKTLYTIHGFIERKATRVAAEMAVLGAPMIRVVDCGDHYMALEGTHRLAAAAQLGIKPNLVVLTQDDVVAADSLDWPDLAERLYTAGELAAEINVPTCGCYRIDNGLLELISNPYYPDCEE